MSKRLTDTGLWQKPWFRKLEPEYKCLWSYLLSNCDNAGVWEVDFEQASFTIGKNIDPALARNLFSEKIIFLDNDRKWFIKNFVRFQNGEILNPKSPIHKRILDLLKKHKIDHQKLFEGQENKDSPTLGPERDTRVVEGEGGVEGEVLVEGEREGEGVKEKEKEKKENVLILPFNSDAFSNAWRAWINYKESQHKFRFKTTATEQIALKELAEKAGNHEQTAIKIIQQSIANGWKGFFGLKTETQNGKQNSKNNDQSGEAVKEWFKRKYAV